MADPPTTTLPAMDFTRFQWRPSPNDPGLYIREAGGGEVIEDFFHRFNHGDQNLFHASRVTLSTPTSLDSVLSSSRKAWAALRFVIPTIASQTAYDDTGNALITYRPALSINEVDAWAQRTVRLADNNQDLDGLRYELGKKHIPEDNGDQVFLYVFSSDPAKTSYNFLLHTSHTPFDGAAVNIIANSFLRHLAHYLSNTDIRPSFQWGRETKNLAPFVWDILGPNEVRTGEKYVSTLSDILADFSSALPRQYGFKLRNPVPGPTRRFQHTFSKAETEQIISSAHMHGFTVNHVAHAAMTMVAAFDNPPTSSTPADATFVLNGLVDSRGRLATEYASRDGYPGYCLGVSAIQIPVSLFKSSPPPESEMKDLLLKTAGVVKAAYRRQKEYPSLLAVTAQQGDITLASLKSSPVPTPMIGPWYAGDGIGERYLDHAHKDSSGKVVLELDDFFVSLNKTDPGPFFRTGSWRGTLRLGIDMNENAIPPSIVQGFMDKWAEILLTFSR